MSVNGDYRDLFKVFNEENVEYLLAGAHAVIFYAEPRYTKDLDIWVNPTEENAQRVWRALEAFGAPLRGISIEDFFNPEMIYQIGIEPNRIDVLMGVGMLDFAEAYQNAVDSTYGNVPIRILSKIDLIQSKRDVGRPKDLLDIDRLESNDS